MKYVFGVRLVVALFVAVLCAIAVSIIEYQHSQQLKFSRDQILKTAQRELTVIRSNLEADIYSDIFFANSLATIVSVTPNSSQTQWHNAAKELFNKSSHLRNIGLAPDDIIQFVYPLQGNEAALGLDFRTIPVQWETVKKARELEAIFIAGPVNLVQGGIGLIARTPIFTDPPLNTQYWGTCSVVLDIESLFTHAGIYEVEKRYNFAIRGKDGKGSQGEVFWGNASVFDSIYASETVVIPSGSWEMAISLESLYEQIPFYEKYGSRLFGYPITGLIIFGLLMVYYFYHRAHDLSIHDELTHLPNRRYFFYTLEQLVSDTQNRSGGFALLNLDLDDFKSVNDTYGHAVGDKLLIEVAKRIKKAVRSSDIVARMGGDEFLVILPRVSELEHVEQIIANVKDSICSKPYQSGQKRIYIEISIGHAICTNSDLSADTLLTLADKSMYKDKENNKAGQESNFD
ncbi:diguanylate cyclase [Vibrio hannami]|uniref:diguanylate cyclase domain-containing protein n=1 Tax=Vibrio hannami TaxID=2717094 RepID=UPI00240EF689|nr:diguanylate cyclase [Vibrio hannami]MDG3087832.1 diguanylate cyclase [Vibrio hannami]